MAYMYIERSWTLAYFKDKGSLEWETLAAAHGWMKFQHWTGEMAAALLYNLVVPTPTCEPWKVRVCNTWQPHAAISRTAAGAGLLCWLLLLLPCWWVSEYENILFPMPTSKTHATSFDEAVFQCKALLVQYSVTCIFSNFIIWVNRMHIIYYLSFLN